MNDDLEKFVRAHREEFDGESPNESIWEKIDEAIGQDLKKKRFSYTHLWRAAAIFFFACSAYLVFQLKYESNKPIGDETIASSSLNSEFAETEAYFITEIAQKEADIAAMNQLNPALIASFKSDINALDSIYTDLKKELSLNSNEQVVNALIQNLQLRMKILNEQLQILENVKNADTDEQVSI